MDIVAGAGGDYHTSYWPQASFLSSRGYHFESTFPAYSELKFVPQNEDVTQGKIELRFMGSSQHNFVCKVSLCNSTQDFISKYRKISQLFDYFWPNLLNVQKSFKSLGIILYW